MAKKEQLTAVQQDERARLKEQNKRLFAKLQAVQKENRQLRAQLQEQSDDDSEV